MSHKINAKIHNKTALIHKIAAMIHKINVLIHKITYAIHDTFRFFTMLVSLNPSLRDAEQHHNG